MSIIYFILRCLQKMTFETALLLCAQVAKAGLF